MLLLVQTKLVLLLLSSSRHLFSIFTEGFRLTCSTYSSRRVLSPSFDCSAAHHHNTIISSSDSSLSSSDSSYHHRYFPCISSSSSPTSTTLTCKKYDDHDEDCCEIVGYNGRIGSFLLRAITDDMKRIQNSNDTDTDTETHTYSTDTRKHTCRVSTINKGETPGISSGQDTPIYVAIPATEVTKVIEKTVPNRREDLVFVTNGIPSDFIQCFHQLNNNDYYDIHNNGTTPDNIITTTVPHFGVLQVGADPISNKLSPPTFIHGKHAMKLRSLLTFYNLNVKVTSSLMEIDAAAIRKLIWVSGMWLLCHDNQNDHKSGHCTTTVSTNNCLHGINVTQVHETKQKQLYELVEKELYPASLELLQRYHPNEIAGLKDAKQIMGSVDDVMSYLESYSYSMPGAIPNKVLAIDEIEQRNGILLSTSIDQPLHKALIERVRKAVK